MTQNAANTIAVMVTRTGSEGEKLTQRFKNFGLGSWYIPTLKITAEEILIPIEDFQQVIFVSPNAVKYSIEKSRLLKELLPDTLIAVGQGTANALNNVGYNQVVIPTEHNSEGLLQLSELQEITGQQILIVKGRGGRKLLSETLQKRGAICHNLDVYCRVTEQISVKLWHDFLSFSKTNIITIASTNALKALNSNFEVDFDYSQLVLIVASQRIKESALELGYKHIKVADSASNNAMFEAVKQLVKTDNTKNYFRE